MSHAHPLREVLSLSLDSMLKASFNLAMARRCNSQVVGSNILSVQKHP
jgi:hypothetical protein